MSNSKTLQIRESLLNRFIKDPRTRKVAGVVCDHWKEIAGVLVVGLIMEDVDTVADMAEASFSVDLMTAMSDGVIETAMSEGGVK